MIGRQHALTAGHCFDGARKEAFWVGHNFLGGTSQFVWYIRKYSSFCSARGSAGRFGRAQIQKVRSDWRRPGRQTRLQRLQQNPGE